MDEMFWLSKTCQVAIYIINDQSHYIKVALGDIFMEDKIRFGMVLGWMVGNANKGPSKGKVVWFL